MLVEQLNNRMNASVLDGVQRMRVQMLRREG